MFPFLLLPFWAPFVAVFLCMRILLPRWRHAVKDLSFFLGRFRLKNEITMFKLIAQANKTNFLEDGNPQRLVIPIFEECTVEVFEKWTFGDCSRDNGWVILVSKIVCRSNIINRWRVLSLWFNLSSRDGAVESIS